MNLAMASQLLPKAFCRSNIWWYSLVVRLHKVGDMRSWVLRNFCRDCSMLKDCIEGLVGFKRGAEVLQSEAPTGPTSVLTLFIKLCVFLRMHDLVSSSENVLPILSCGGIFCCLASCFIAIFDFLLFVLPFLMTDSFLVLIDRWSLSFSSFLKYSIRFLTFVSFLPSKSDNELLIVSDAVLKIHNSNVASSSLLHCPDFTLGSIFANLLNSAHVVRLGKYLDIAEYLPSCFSSREISFSSSSLVQ